jgi:hypothetical protein
MYNFFENLRHKFRAKVFYSRSAKAYKKEISKNKTKKTIISIHNLFNI